MLLLQDCHCPPYPSATCERSGTTLLPPVYIYEYLDMCAIRTTLDFHLACAGYPGSHLHPVCFLLTATDPESGGNGAQSACNGPIRSCYTL
jgi:hypothetical protein